MTKVHIDLQAPASDGHAAEKGVVFFRPTRRLTIEDGKAILTPRAFCTKLADDGTATVDLMPSGDDWCWEVREELTSYTFTRRVTVPDSTDVLEYAELADAELVPASSYSTLVHSMRVIDAQLTAGATITITDLRPSDHVGVGDTVVDSTGEVFMLTKVSGQTAIVGDTGVSLKGADGIQGKDGTGISIKGTFDSEEALKAAHPTGESGDAYLVQGHIWLWDESSWQDAGSLQGPKGDKGDPGPQGEPGKDGTDGKDGEKGEKGDPGERGDPGKDGADGEKGEKGVPGEKGDPGTPGEKGADGKDGEQGPAGKDGKDGIQAIQASDEADATTKSAADSANLYWWTA